MSQKKTGLELCSEIAEQVQGPLFDILRKEVARGSDPLLVWAVIHSIIVYNVAANTTTPEFNAWTDLAYMLLDRFSVGKVEELPTRVH